MTRFPLGQLVMTRGVAQHFRDDVSPLLGCVARHCRGDWGDVDAHDARANVVALADDARLLSSYRVDNVKIWIITEADRSSTTILFPEEY